jgi:polyphosphate glucokinase
MNRILCFDIGGTGIKAMLFDESGKPLSDRLRIPTPDPATPNAVFRVLRTIFDEPPISRRAERIAAGFPGIVKDGKAVNAPNLSPSWKNFPLQESLEHEFKVPARVANDADVQALGANQGKGLELTITLGTGVGSGLVYDGALIPNIELGHHPFRHGQTYEQQLGKPALDEIGKQRWNSRVLRMIQSLSTAFNFDRLYLGGGNVKHFTETHPKNVQLIGNFAGLAGGVRLWNPHATELAPLLRAV